MSLPSLAGSPAAAGSPRPWAPGALATLCVLLGLHVALIAWAVAGLFPESRYNPVDDTKLRQVATLAAIALAASRWCRAGKPRSR